MDLIYRKSYEECKDSGFDGQIDDENSKAALRMSAEIDDIFECMGYPQTISNIEKNVRSCYDNIFLNLELMTGYLNLLFV